MNKEQTSNGISIGTVVFLIFLVLKLAGIGIVATWSWWVTSPLWIPLAFALLLIVGALLITAIAKIFEW